MVGPSLAAAAGSLCGIAQAALNIGSAVCYATILLGDLRDPMEEAIAFASENGVPFVASAGNVLSRSSLPEILRDLIDVDNAVADDWNFVPAVLPKAIAAGAVGDNWPFANIHFYGPSVDIWAPIRSTHFSPPTIDAVTGSDQQTLKSFGGTSAAAPYTAGLIAAMQAVNPELNRHNPALTPAQRAAIVDRVTALLRDNAWTNQELIDMAPPDQADAVAAAAAQRRNMINPLRTISAAGAGVIPDLAALGYTDDLDFDETTAVTAADTAADAHPIAEGETIAGAIVTILGENGAPDLFDVDWFTFALPIDPPGSWHARFKLRVPGGFGPLTTDTPGYEIQRSIAQSSPEEDVYLILSPPLQEGSTGSFRILPAVDSDNVYRLTYEMAEWVSDIVIPLPEAPVLVTDLLICSFSWMQRGPLYAVLPLQGDQAVRASCYWTRPAPW